MNVTLRRILILAAAVAASVPVFASAQRTWQIRLLGTTPVPEKNADIGVLDGYATFLNVDEQFDIDTSQVHMKGVTPGFSIGWFDQNYGIRGNYFAPAKSKISGEKWTYSGPIGAAPLTQHIVTEGEMTMQEYGLDVFYMFGRSSSVRWSVGAGVFQSTVSFFNNYDYDNDPMWGDASVVAGTGSQLGYKGFVGADWLFTNTIGLSFELGYKLQKIEKFIADKDFWAGPAIGSPLYKKGEPIRRNSSDRNNMVLNLSSAYASVALLIAF